MAAGNKPAPANQNSSDFACFTCGNFDKACSTEAGVGSSMDKCVKCNVYLNSLDDYDGMNEVFRGRFGENPPVRTTIAAAGGIPGNSLVEIDVIAYI